MADDQQPAIKVPLENWVREIAREAAWTVIKEHRQECHIEQVEKRVGQLEVRVSTLIGFMAGSGLLGGLAGALLSRAVGG